jgi:hypothetical protein
MNNSGALGGAGAERQLSKLDAIGESKQTTGQIQ